MVACRTVTGVSLAMTELLEWWRLTQREECSSLKLSVLIGAGVRSHRTISQPEESGYGLVAPT
jgi:hypothetical protein